MCGICGVLLDGRTDWVAPETLQAMCRTIAHRGPDDEGVFLDGSVGLGIRRLSIIDPVGGRQPIASENGAVVVVFNGEIYNHRQLRDELMARGHTFATRSDTEVLVHGYEEFGNDFVRRLRGMFAFALWDARREHLFAAVDRFGMKPLYWGHSSKGLVFGSELSSVLASGFVPRELDKQSLSEYFALGYVPAPASILVDVHKLLPGTWLRWARGSDTIIERYWQPPMAEGRDDSDPRELQAMVLGALRDAVRSHVVSDVPLGAFLSGGIDSSVIVALMAEAASPP
jgi:asparagine synthase (glutamine-hydrolysing)